MSKLQKKPLKEAIQHFKKWTSTNFFLDPDPDFESRSGSTGPIEYGSNPDPKPWT